jgi:hypothetical protein
MTMSWLWLSAVWAAPPATLVGTVGDYPVRLTLPGAGAGSLTYVRKNAGFGLAGSCTSTCTLTELGPDGKPTGAITATWSGSTLSGTWETPDHKKKLPFSASGGPEAAVVWTRAETWRREAGAFKSEPVEVKLPALLVADPAVQAKLDVLFDVKNLVGDPVAQILADGWVDSVDHEVVLQRAGVVAVLVHVEGSGAYPDRTTRALTVDARTGAQIGLEALTTAGSTALVAAVEAEVQRRKRTAEPEIVSEIADVHFDATKLAGFYPNAEGLVFRVDWGLPHAIAAGAPDSLVVIPWTQCASALAPGSALTRAVK